MEFGMDPVPLTGRDAQPHASPETVSCVSIHYQPLFCNWYSYRCAYIQWIAGRSILIWSINVGLNVRNAQLGLMKVMVFITGSFCV